MQFQRHRPRYIDAIGGCYNCNGMCQGAKTPKQLMDAVLQHVEDGKLTGGQVARSIMDYRGNGMYGEGFFDDLVSGFKKGFSAVANVAAPVLSMIPHPAAQMASRVAGTLGAMGGRRKRTTRRKVRMY